MKGKKKYLWALWLVILCALLMITGTYAAYIFLQLSVSAGAQRQPDAAEDDFRQQPG